MHRRRGDVLRESLSYSLDYETKHMQAASSQADGCTEKGEREVQNIIYLDFHRFCCCEEGCGKKFGVGDCLYSVSLTQIYLEISSGAPPAPDLACFPTTRNFVSGVRES